MIESVIVRLVKLKSMKHLDKHSRHIYHDSLRKNSLTVPIMRKKRLLYLKEILQLVRYGIKYLISVEFTSIHFFFSLLLKCNNDQSYEHVQKEERKHNNKTDIVQGHLNLVVLDRPLILFGRVNSVIHSSEGIKEEASYSEVKLKHTIEVTEQFSYRLSCKLIQEKQ